MAFAVSAISAVAGALLQEAIDLAVILDALRLLRGSRSSARVRRPRGADP